MVLIRLSYLNMVFRSQTGIQGLYPHHWPKIQFHQPRTVQTRFRLSVPQKQGISKSGAKSTFLLSPLLNVHKRVYLPMYSADSTNSIIIFVFNV